MLLLIFAFLAFAQEKAIPYLGPGADKLSRAEYERIYKNYIQTSVLLGYPFLSGSRAPCEEALNQVFRQVGMFAYPVPKDASGVARWEKKISGKQVETYELAGNLLQLDRNSVGAPERLFWLNSSSTVASRRLGKVAKTERLSLEKDKITGLERVKGHPVGFPHPYLNKEGQGLFVRVLSFNGKKEGCQPTDYFDNSWSNGFDLSQARCVGLRADAEAVWAEKMKPEEFRARELKRLKERSLETAKSHGMTAQEAAKTVEKIFKPPFTSEINVVGGAMRNLAQCNLLALSEKEVKARIQAAPTAEGEPSSGSAE